MQWGPRTDLLGLLALPCGQQVTDCHGQSHVEHRLFRRCCCPCTPGDPLPSDRRRKWCDTPKNLVGKQFSPDYVYTFHIWQHLIDFSTYSLSVGGFVNLDLTHALNCQPLQLTCKDTHSEEYMFSMLVWHERLLYGSDTSAAAALAERLSRWGAGFRSLLGGNKK